MKRITLMLVIITLMMVTLGSASLGTFKQNECVNIKTILNSTSVNISTISYPNSTIVVSNQVMTKVGQTFNYTFCNTSTLGTYTYDYYDNLGYPYVNDFTITTNGKDLSTGDSILYLLGLGIATFFFVMSLYFSITIPFKNTRNEDGRIISVNKLKYLKLVMIGITYSLLIMIVGLLNGIFSNFNNTSNLATIFNYLYWILLSILYPAIVLIFIGIIVFLVEDNILNKKIKRGSYR